MEDEWQPWVELCGTRVPKIPKGTRVQIQGAYLSNGRRGRAGEIVTQEGVVGLSRDPRPKGAPSPALWADAEAYFRRTGYDVGKAFRYRIKIPSAVQQMRKLAENPEGLTVDAQS